MEACSDDADLRREVESLLAAHEDAGTFLQAPAFEVAAEQSAEGSSGEKTTLPETRVEPFAPGLILDGRYVIEKELEQGSILSSWLN